MYEYNRTPTPQELMHFGIAGMRWGTRHGQKSVDRMIKRVDKSMQKYDAGSRRVDAGTFKEQSRQVRRLTYKNNKRIARMNAYLNRTKGESVNNIAVKMNKDPEKVAKVKDYLARSQIEAKRLSEIRTQLMDVKLDAM